jgi:uncharacterized membrane protein YhaH (DUF805 family)
MKGRILHYDHVAHEGIIVGDDEKRYSFKKDDVKNILHVQKGMEVEFIPEGTTAKDLYLTDNISDFLDDMSIGYYEEQVYNFKELFCSQGCYNRWQYWRITLISFAIWSLFGIYISMVVLNSNEIADENVIVVTALVLFLLLPLWYVNVVTSIKRFHDIDKSGWFYLLSFIPYIGSFIVMLINGFIPTKKEGNRFCKKKKGI